MAKEKIVYDGTNISEFAKSMKASIATITETGNNIVEENGEEFLEPIEDDEEYESIAEIFMERLEDLYDFES